MNFDFKPQLTDKRIITYGTFDLLHYGHINLLRRAKELGNYLMVGLADDEFNRIEKGKKAHFSYEQRRYLLQSVRYVDLVIKETSWDQKIHDIQLYKIDVFAIGDDWRGKFDYLKDYCEIVYFERTPEISTTQIKQNIIKNVGGGGNILSDNALPLFLHILEGMYIALCLILYSLLTLHNTLTQGVSDE